MSQLEQMLKALSDGAAGKKQMVHNNIAYDYELIIVYDPKIPELSPGNFGFMAWTEGLQQYGLPKLGHAVDTIINPGPLTVLSDELSRATQECAGEYAEEVAQALRMIKHLVDRIESKVRKAVCTI